MRFITLMVASILVIAGTSLAEAQLYERYIKGYQGAYRGRVVDAETKEPLAGAVVVAIWYREKIQLIQLSTVFHDAREVLTDADGEFVLDAPDVEKKAPAKTLRPYFVVFTPGYALSRGTREARGETIELRRLRTHSERLEVVGSLPPSVPDEKIPHLIRLMNSEERSLGLEPTHLPREK